MTEQMLICGDYEEARELAGRRGWIIVRNEVGRVGILQPELVTAWITENPARRVLSS